MFDLQVRRGTGQGRSAPAESDNSPKPRAHSRARGVHPSLVLLEPVLLALLDRAVAGDRRIIDAAALARAARCLLGWRVERSQRLLDHCVGQDAVELGSIF